MIAVASHGPSTLWYVTRGAGAVSLVLLTASVALGIGQNQMWRPAGMPRFTIAALHRSLSLLALTFLVLHVLTVLLDPFPPIGVTAALVPFATSYRPLWLGLGTIALDLLLAIVVTSLLRARLGYRSWRSVHWLAYLSWPVALLHGFGAGSDAKSLWMLALTAGCTAVVLVAVARRLAADGVPAGLRVSAGAGGTLGVLALFVWIAQGPLASGWARRAGTPQSVLAAFAPPRAVRVAAGPPADPLVRPFTATVQGQLHNGISADGIGVVDLSMALSGGPAGRLRIRLGGEPLQGGGLHMDRSSVTLGPPNDPGRYRGRIDFLEGSRLRALVGARDGRAIRLILDLSLRPGSVTGQVRGAPAGVTGR